ncbi:MAG: glutamate--tRNA ligase [Actinobacteria bacterium]|nr:glutamate--tRNA ligase [Actinomycetota bacterium]
MSVRVRIAPSPTGPLHIGNLRSALFNWLFARHEGGVFIVRIDDTDSVRSHREYEDDAQESLRWLGLDWDEGVGVGGPHGSYRQSDRLDRYREVADALLDQGKAYRCFCTPDELTRRRELARAQGGFSGYDGVCRLIDPEEAAQRKDSGEASALRLAVPRPGETRFQDLVRGEMRFDHADVDDFILLRSDGSPTYHLASTVDDVDYGITHVVRGEDLLSSTPKHILITKAMGAPVATYAHLPLLFGPDGKKLSKRHGDVSVQAYRDRGILPEAMFNYLALLGWSYEPDVTVFTKEQAVERFDLADVSKNPAVFDPAKLEWMNGVYIRNLDADGFVSRAVPFVEVSIGRTLTDDERERFRKVSPLIQERVKSLTEVAPMVAFVFTDRLEYDEKSWRKVLGHETAPAVLVAAIERLGRLAEWDHAAIESALRAMLEDLGIGARRGLQPVRVAVTGSSVSPPLFESLEILGKEVTLHRLRDVAARLES